MIRSDSKERLLEQLGLAAPGRFVPASRQKHRSERIRAATVREWL
jgi:hypothetical protein